MVAFSLFHNRVSSFSLGIIRCFFHFCLFVSFDFLVANEVWFDCISHPYRWEKPGHAPIFGYDFWYQPRHKTMISSSWGAPSAFSKGFNLQHVSDGLYGRHLNVYSWPDGEIKQTLDLGNSGLLPLEVSISCVELNIKLQ